MRLSKDDGVSMWRSAVTSARSLGSPRYHSTRCAALVLNACWVFCYMLCNCMHTTRTRAILTQVVQLGSEMTYSALPLEIFVVLKLSFLPLLTPSTSRLKEFNRDPPKPVFCSQDGSNLRSPAGKYSSAFPSSLTNHEASVLTISECDNSSPCRPWQNVLCRQSPILQQHHLFAPRGEAAVS